MSRYPDAHQIEEMWAQRGNLEAFQKYVTDPCDVVLAGQEAESGGKYRSMSHALENGFAKNLMPALKHDTVRMEVKRVMGGSDSPWAAVEMAMTADTKHGKPFHGEIVYIVRFNGEGKMNYMKLYSDTAHVHRHINDHKKHVEEHGDAKAS